MINVDTFTIAFIFAILGFGVLISFKILNITDLTVEASYTFGGAIAIVFCKMQLPLLALFMAFGGGMIAGLITSLLHTKLKINAILSGILTLTAFYSINLLVTKRVPDIYLKKNAARYFIFYKMNDVTIMFVTFSILLLVALLISLFFKTKTGLSLRACGDNEEMTKTACISTDKMKILGLSLSNGLVALAGALFVEFQGSYSSSIGTGIMVVGVACIIIGEIFTLGKHNLELILGGITLGSIVYRIIYSLCLSFNFIQASDLKLISSLLLVLILALSEMKNVIKQKINLKKESDFND